MAGRPLGHSAPATSKQRKSRQRVPDATGAGT
jgi:hypothetical protein